MRINCVKIHNYRSYRDVAVNLSPYTVVVGPNNVGKSNILRVIQLFFYSDGDMRSRRLPPYTYTRRISTRRREPVYDYLRDFPVEMQGVSGGRHTKVVLSVSLDDKDFNELGLDKKFQAFGEISIIKTIKNLRQKELTTDYKIPKLKDPEKQEFLEWLFRTSDFILIPSSRTAEVSEDLLRSFSSRIFSDLEGSKAVRKAFGALEKRAQKEIIKAEKSIYKKLLPFIPGLKSLSLELGDLPDISDLLDIVRIKIEDKTSTYLSNKGDGVQSLFFIGLMQYASAMRAGRNLIFGIEEPELHLHPDAQEVLVKTLKTMAAHNQVILTTHSPVLVNRGDLLSNVVVTTNANGKIEPINTKSLRTIREVLGVRLNHNLNNAKLVVVMEGADDLEICKAAFKHVAPHLIECLDSGELSMVYGRGYGGVVGYLENATRNLQACVAVFDNDLGREKYEQCKSSSLLEAADLFLVPVAIDRQEAEIEDLFPVEYSIRALSNFGIVIQPDIFKKYVLSTGGKHRKPQKWSAAIEKILSDHGHSGDLEKLKLEFVKIVSENLKASDIHPFFKGIAGRIDMLLKDETSSS